MRRKELHYATRCFYCPEPDIFCLEAEHPVTRELDADFKRVVCCNCHRKLEGKRDLTELTKNGQRHVHESEGEAFRRYLLLIAEDQETIADSALTTPPELIAKALQETAASLRRKLQSVTIV